MLGALLYLTFLQVPFTRVTAAFRDARFLGTVLAVNFVAVPLVVAGLVAVAPLKQAVLLGVLLTLLTPVHRVRDRVLTGLAGGDSQRLVAVSPLLMLAQLAALPVLLWLFVGPELADIVETRPFVEAFEILILLPLALAGTTEAFAALRRAGQVVIRGMNAAMVPIMAATLFVVVGSQVPKLEGRFDDVATAAPVYAAFLVIMAVVGVAAARVARLEVGRARALVFTGATRNSLVVLPLALALPAAYAVTPAIVVT